MIADFFRALRDPRTYWPPRNIFAAFGFLWGLPIPLFSIALHRLLGGDTEAILGAWSMHLVFALHPFLFAVLFGAMGTMQRWKEEALVASAETDELTGLANHRLLRRRLSEEIERSRRSGEPLALAMIDLDHFKPVNDRYGHLAGDEVLREAARRLNPARREYDVLGRYGGDEFVMIFPRTVKADAVLVAERMREAIAKTPFPVMEGAADRVVVTATIGVASFPVDGGGADALLVAADRAMYAAKAAGRNRVQTA